MSESASRKMRRTPRRQTRKPPVRRRPLRVISGGQTGVDRAALDAARECGIETGGWCPRGRRAEDGVIDLCYPLHQTESRAYHERTRLNVRDSDATLILTCGPLTGGTRLTRDLAALRGVPVLIVDRTQSPDDASQRVTEWIEAQGIQVLNVAGPRESTAPGIYAWARAVLVQALAE